MQAFILAGGLGTRLRSVVSDRPKVLAPVDGKPFLQHQIEYLHEQGIEEIVLCVGYRYRQILDVLAKSRMPGVQVRYSIEPSLLGTAGALGRAQSLIDGPFLLLNGDTWFPFHLAELIEFHRQQCARVGSALGTLAVTEVSEGGDYGTVAFDRRHCLTRFAEKPHRASRGRWISAGVYLFQPDILRWIPAGRPVSLEREVIPAVLARGERLFAYPAAGCFVDIGTPAGYRKFQEYVQEHAHAHPK